MLKKKNLKKKKKRKKIPVVPKVDQCMMGAQPKFQLIRPQSGGSKGKSTCCINYANEHVGNVTPQVGNVTQGGQRNISKVGEVTQMWAM